MASTQLSRSLNFITDGHLQKHKAQEINFGTIECKFSNDRKFPKGKFLIIIHDLIEEGQSKGHIYIYLG